MTNLVIHLVIWAVLATVVVFLAIYRRRIYMKSDEVLHVLDAEAPLVSTQAVVAKKLERIDFWGKALTVVVVLYALALVGVYIYGALTDTTIKLN